VNRLLVFGVGDLTERYIVPAVAELVGRGDAGDLQVTLVGREPMERDELCKAVRSWLGDVDDDTVSHLLEVTNYRRADATDVEQVRDVVPTDEPYVAYLALPPTVFADAVRAVAETLPRAGTRIVVEKPFGSDAASAEEFNEQLQDAVGEEAVFRVDHFLGMQTAHDLLLLRFGNSVFEPLWNARHIERVEIVWDEQLALEGRADYYDGAGAARDMVQNHLLQLLCLVAMEPPAELTSDHLSDRKIEVLRATRAVDPTDPTLSRRARYTAGQAGDHWVPSYVDEDGVDPERCTETFAEITVAVNTPRWHGVPFALRTGKALDRDRHEIAVHFSAVPPVSFCDSPPSNVLRFQFGSGRVRLSVVRAADDGVFGVEPVELEHLRNDSPMSAYARVLADVLGGGNVLSVRGDEAVEAWRVLQPVLDAWDRADVPLGEYPAGSSGPAPHEVPPSG
jgi:glucose-6-phosphate 1-dehydrogenase